jgi:hypothetical protein
MEGGTAKCKIGVPARLWANSLDALVSAAKEGAGIVQAPSWQVVTDIEIGHLRQFLAEHDPPPTPVHLVFQPTRLASPKPPVCSWIIWPRAGRNGIRLQLARCGQDRYNQKSESSFALYGRCGRAGIPSPLIGLFSYHYSSEPRFVFEAFRRCTHCFQFVNRIHLLRSPKGRHWPTKHKAAE